ncbi:hypothetical protein ACOME3_003116 [Neoechinorhynchus agilis]
MGNEIQHLRSKESRKIEERIQRAQQTGILQATSMKLHKVVPIKLSVGETLRHIDLSRNSIKNVTVEFMRSIPNIRHLNLNSNLIETFVCLDTLTKLEELSIRNNRLIKAPENLPICLKRLDISSNRIRSLSPLFHLTKLEELNADNNTINAVQDGVVILEALVNLSLINNQVENLSPLIGRLSKLRTLKLDNNKLKCLAEEDILVKSGICQITGLDSNPLDKPFHEMIGYDEYMERHTAMKLKGL